MTVLALPTAHRSRGMPRKYDYEKMRARYAEHGSITKLVAEFVCCYMTAKNIVSSPVEERLTRARFASRPVADQTASMPPYNHPALMNGTTMYPHTVRGGRERWALKSGVNTAKIGARILKGKWAGFPAYTLTLEERATCPYVRRTRDRSAVGS